ncbi:ninja-family protein mc410-like [Mangifera indica]|uniref:ninja-family protein mc410-like n=1 Tax=Mangifera indica TaxID=29780 RepID=UPI001CF9DC08|nr:ninja-family protein mc410-like [Mangifera indica]
MEDDTGLELSLGLSFGGSAAKSKGKNGRSSDAKTEEDDRGNNRDDLKNFLNGANQKQDSGTGSQRSDSVKPQENFFNDLSKANANMNLNSRRPWVTNSRPEIEEAKRLEASNKRKLLFDDINIQKKHQREAHPADSLNKTKTSYISITEEGSTAENEDVAESEVEGSTSRLVSHHDDGSKQYIGVGGASEVPKDIRSFSNSNIVNVQGQKRFNSSSENECKLGNTTYGVPFSVQSLNIMNFPYTISMKESSSTGVHGSSGHPLPGMIQKMPTSSNEHQGAQSTNPGNLPVMVGYSAVQLPTFDKDNSWGMVSQSQQLCTSYAGRGPPNLDKQNDGLKMSEATMQFDGRTIEWAKVEGKQHGTEEGSSTQAEEDGKVSGMNNRAKDASDRSTVDGLTFDLSAIKPGIEADLKFGGCGSYPDLPWVSTKGSGPNGRTISGVTYRYSANQIKIVCACHGCHMSPEEFVRHANDEHSNQEGGAGLLTFSSSNPAASAQS